MNDTHGGVDGIAVTGLTKRYDHVNVLDDMTIHFTRGKIHGLFGRNGAGKTTLMSIVCRHKFQTSGEVRIDGADPSEHAGVLGRTCFVHEDQRWHDIYTVGMILRSAARFYAGWDHVLCERLIHRFALPQDIRVRKLSRGQRSALAICIGLASHAQYTFLDEPYLGLDATARGVLYEELALTQADDPRTFLMSSHLIDECAALLDTVTIIQQGHVIYAGDAETATADVWCFTGLREQAQRILTGADILSTSSMGALSTLVFRASLNEDQLAALRAGSVASIRHASLQELVSAVGAVEPQHDDQGALQ